jgi:hypothetical protein
VIFGKLGSVRGLELAIGKFCPCEIIASAWGGLLQRA